MGRADRIHGQRGFILLLSVIIGAVVICMMMSTMLRAIFTPPAATVIDNRTGTPVPLVAPADPSMSPHITMGVAQQQVESFNNTVTQRMNDLMNISLHE